MLARGTRLSMARVALPCLRLLRLLQQISLWPQPHRLQALAPLLLSLKLLLTQALLVATRLQVALGHLLQAQNHPRQSTWLESLCSNTPVRLLGLQPMAGVRLLLRQTLSAPSFGCGLRITLVKTWSLLRVVGLFTTGQ